MKAVRLDIAHSKKLKAAYIVCKDEHLAAIVKNPEITEDEIKNLPNASNIMLKEFAHLLHEAYQKILQENSVATATVTDKKDDEESVIPF